MNAPVVVPPWLRAAREASADGLSWLDRLPELIGAACDRWRLEVSGPPYEGGVCGWVAPVSRADGSPAVLKVTWPHPEAAQEPAALRCWAGKGAIRVLEDDRATWTMLLEACRPGTPLRDADLPVERGLEIGANLLNALWGEGARLPPGHDFDSMAETCDRSADVAAGRARRYGKVLARLGVDLGVLDLGIQLLRSLPRSAGRQVLVHGDFNPGNLLAAERSPFLAIDPKPLVGDPAYDPWQLVAQLGWPFRREDAASLVWERIRRLADLLDLAPERIAAWGVARDVEGGLWATSVGDPETGAKWIRSATLVAPLLDRPYPRIRKSPK
ncbi:MAG TPA: aminoglycoside phosphotransferase family protein [Trebonia sp.]